MLNKPRLLVLSAPFGSGHTMAAEALCQYYREVLGGKADHVDFLSYLNPKLSKYIVGGFLMLVRKTPELFKLMYENTDKPLPIMEDLSGIISFKKYGNLIREYNPDLIISTNALPAATVSFMYPDYPITNGVVLTDYIAHRMWVYPNNQKFFVSNLTMKKDLMDFGVAEEKICISGIPIRNDFLKIDKKKKLKKKLGLNDDLPLVLLMSGGSAVSSLDKALMSLSKINKPFQTIVVCGKNMEMYEKLRNCLENLCLKGKALAFVNNIHEYMGAADILVSKAGGLTISESLVLGLPMVIIDPIPGQEDGNTKFLTKAGAAVYVKNCEELGKTIKDLLDSSKDLDKISLLAKKLAKPDASKIIIREMIFNKDNYNTKNINESLIKKIIGKL